VGKLAGFSEREKADMLTTFTSEPHRAYAYAITDAVLTLLVKGRDGGDPPEDVRGPGISGGGGPAPAVHAGQPGRRTC
jgi:hypothetical protein